MLLSFGEALRVGGVVASREHIKHFSAKYSVDDFSVDEELREFERRKVLESRDGGYRCKVPFFEKWLTERGVNSIITGVIDPDNALERRKREESYRVRPEEIVELTNKWGYYKGRRCTEDQVRSWLNQWGVDLSDQRLMFQLLQNIRFYSAGMIREKLREAHGIITRGTFWNKQGLKRSDMIISYLDSPGKSGANYARLYAEENEVYVDQVVEQSRLEKHLLADGTKILVFMDDFLGSGDSASENLQNMLQRHQQALATSSLSIYVMAICGFNKARTRIERIAEEFNLGIKIRPYRT